MAFFAIDFGDPIDDNLIFDTRKLNVGGLITKVQDVIYCQNFQDTHHGGKRLRLKCKFLFQRHTVHQRRGCPVDRKTLWTIIASTMFPPSRETQ